MSSKDAHAERRRKADQTSSCEQMNARCRHADRARASARARARGGRRCVRGVGSCIRTRYVRWDTEALNQCQVRALEKVVVASIVHDLYGHVRPVRNTRDIQVANVKREAERARFA